LLSAVTKASYTSPHLGIVIPLAGLDPDRQLSAGVVMMNSRMALEATAGTKRQAAKGRRVLSSARCGSA